MAVEKIHCPFHNDSTPSMVIYPTNAYCFGCGKSATHQEVGLANRFTRRATYPKEDMEASLKRIAKLPTKLERGFNLPYDDLGYYIVYPKQVYYTKRLFNPPKPSLKYKSPYGHAKKLYIPSFSKNTKTLFIVEGQLNALSFSAITTFMTISPGAASDLNRREFVNYYLRYPSMCIIVDKDPAGVAAAIELKTTLVKQGKKVVITALTKPKDFNYLYVNEGPESLKEQEQKALELLNLQHRGGLSTSTEGAK